MTKEPFPPTITAAPLAGLAPLDVHALYKLRVDVFVHEQATPYAEIDNTDAQPSTIHLLAWDSPAQEQAQAHTQAPTQDPTPRLLGTARLFPATIPNPEAANTRGTADTSDSPTLDVVQFGRFALAPAARGTGLGPQLIDAALQFAATARPDTPVYLEAQSPLTGYYGRFGFSVCGEPFDEDSTLHTPMIKRATTD